MEPRARLRRRGVEGDLAGWTRPRCGKAISEARHLDTGKRGDFSAETFEAETGLSWCDHVRHREPKGENVLGSKTGIRPHEAVEALQEEPTADQERVGEGDFTHDEESSPVPRP